MVKSILNRSDHPSKRCFDYIKYGVLSLASSVTWVFLQSTLGREGKFYLIFYTKIKGVFTINILRFR